MSIWRFGRGWSERELRAHLVALRHAKPNFDALPEQMTPANGWTLDGDDDVIGREPPGPPFEDGVFLHARQGIITYDFSDPRIVIGHFDPRVPLSGRDMLLEFKVWGFHFLNGVRVNTVRDEQDAHRSSFGFRYDTLEGHIEQGFEWFLLSKHHDSGEVRFRVEAHWRMGRFPNWWSRLGFVLIGNWYRKLWRRRAVERLRRLAYRPPAGAVADTGQLAHRGDLSPHRRTSVRG